jgi:hypothetical protein
VTLHTARKFLQNSNEGPVLKFTNLAEKCNSNSIRFVVYLQQMFSLQFTYFSVHFQYAFLKYVAYLQSTYLKEKIRIGYILKSAEVRILVSRRYSEKSSHIPAHLSTLAYTQA